MHAFIPRDMDYTDSSGTTSYNAGYHNAALGVTGIAILFPPGARGAWVSVSAGCYIGVRDSNTLATFSDANYGSVLNGTPAPVLRGAVTSSTTGDATKYLHLAPWATTAIVAVCFF